MIQVGIDPRCVHDAVWSSDHAACHVVVEHTPATAPTCGWIVYDEDPILGGGLPWRYVACDAVRSRCIDPLIGPVPAPCETVAGWRYLPLLGRVEAVRPRSMG
jgi:hypothetical protein